jgi:cytochrome c556
MKALLLIAGFFLFTPLFAQTTQDDPQREALKETMRTFASALDLMQEGILHNSSDKMLQGVQMLKGTKRGFLEKHGQTLERYMPKDPKFARSYARITGDRIEGYIDSLDTQIKFRQEYSRTAATYGHIMQACVGCHQKLRK